MAGVKEDPRTELLEELLGMQEEIASLMNNACPDLMHPTDFARIYGLTLNRFMGARYEIAEQLSSSKEMTAEPFIQANFGAAIQLLEKVSMAEEHASIGDHEISTDDKKSAQHAIDRLNKLAESLHEFGELLGA